MKFHQLLEKHNVIITFVLSLAGLVAGLITNDNDILFKGLIVGLFVVILLQMITNKNLNSKISQLEIKIKRLNTTIDKKSLDSINKFRSYPDRNIRLSHEEMIQTLTVKGKDGFLEFEYAGHCIHPDGEDALYSDLYAGSDIKFDDLKFYYYDLKSDPYKKHKLKATSYENDRHLFLTKNRFSKKLLKGDYYHLVYYCTFVDCFPNANEHYTTHVPRCRDGLKKYEFVICFEGEQPERVEVFDGTHGGESTFVEKLNCENNASPYVYRHTVRDVYDVKDYIYQFKK